MGVEEDYYCGRGRSVRFFGGADFSYFLDFCEVEALVGGGVLEYVRSAWDGCGGIL